MSDCVGYAHINICVSRAHDMSFLCNVFDVCVLLSAGKVYYEATLRDEGIMRVGWSSMAASREVGTDAFGYIVCYRDR